MGQGLQSHMTAVATGNVSVLLSFLDFATRTINVAAISSFRKAHCLPHFVTHSQITTKHMKAPIGHTQLTQILEDLEY